MGDSFHQGDVTPTKPRPRQGIRPSHFNKQTEASDHLSRQHFSI